MDAKQHTESIRWWPGADLSVKLADLSDLIESSKQFDTKHGSGHLQGAAAAAAEQRRQAMAGGGAAAASHLCLAPAAEDSATCMLSLFQSEHGSPGARQTQRLKDEHGFAFDNPYFRDERHYQQQIRRQQQQQQQQQQTAGLLATGNDTGPQSPYSDLNREEQRGVVGQQLGPDNEHLHFIEHHISNLHARQVTSSVKELSILGSPQAANAHVAHVVDLTSAEQRSKVIADPKEGDLVAVDITGHDIIGLGFDVCGNAQEGIFIKSVLARGPARESGCIERGDRIKCLNISFDNVTLQDACDILNCGSPYKMRLLIEKRVAPAALISGSAKHSSSNSATSRYNRHSQLGSPFLGVYCRAQAMADEPAREQATVAGPFRTYIRRLTNLLPGQGFGSGAKGHQQAMSLDYQQHRAGGRQTPMAAHLLTNSSTAGSERQLLASGEPIHLGSAAARRHLAASGSAFFIHDAGGGGVDQTQLGHDNPAFASANGSTCGDLEAAEQDTAHQPHPPPLGALVSPGRQSDSRRRSHLAHSDSTGSSNLRGGRFSVDSGAGGDGGGGSNDTFTDQPPELTHADSSLDFHAHNVHHRLHGPQFDPSLKPADTDLRLAGAASHSRLLASGSVPSAAAEWRHQSAAGVNELIVATSEHELGNGGGPEPLGQSQSQPEIAIRADNEPSPNEGNSVAGRFTQQSKQQSTTGRLASNPLMSRQANKALVGSMSTPTMNLLSGDRLTSPGEQWPPKGTRKDTIKEEPAGSDSSFADSTSKLVAKEVEEEAPKRWLTSSSSERAATNAAGAPITTGTKGEHQAQARSSGGSAGRPSNSAQRRSTPALLGSSSTVGGAGEQSNVVTIRDTKLRETSSDASALSRLTQRIASSDVRDLD